MTLNVKCLHRVLTHMYIKIDLNLFRLSYSTAFWHCEYLAQAISTDD